MYFVKGLLLAPCTSQSLKGLSYSHSRILSSVIKHYNMALQNVKLTRTASQTRKAISSIKHPWTVTVVVPSLTSIIFADTRHNINKLVLAFYMHGYITGQRQHKIKLPCLCFSYRLLWNIFSIYTNDQKTQWRILAALFIATVVESWTPCKLFFCTVSSHR